MKSSMASLAKAALLGDLVDTASENTSLLLINVDHTIL